MVWKPFLNNTLINCRTRINYIANNGFYLDVPCSSSRQDVYKFPNFRSPRNFKSVNNVLKTGGPCESSLSPRRGITRVFAYALYWFTKTDDFFLHWTGSRKWIFALNFNATATDETHPRNLQQIFKENFLWHNTEDVLIVLKFKFALRGVSCCITAIHTYILGDSFFDQMQENNYIGVALRSHFNRLKLLC